MTTDRVGAPDADQPGLLEVIWEVVEMTAGLGIALLPLFILAMPGIILFVILPTILLLPVAAALVALSAALAVPPYFIVRAVRRWRRRRLSAGQPR